MRAVAISFLLVFYTSFTNAQAFKNLDFRELCDTSKTGLCYWDLSWGSKGSVRQHLDGKISCLLIKGAKNNDVCFTEQSAVIDSAKRMQIITVSATIRTHNVKGKGAGLNVQIVNADNSLAAFKDMGGFYSVSWIRGTTSWKRYSISLVCPQKAYKVKIGAILYGNGEAYFKNYKVQAKPIAARQPNRLALKYISSVCDTIKKHSLLRDSIDIDLLRKTALKIAGSAANYSDCYLAVNYLLDALRPYGDDHSFFMTPKEVKNLENGGSLISKIENPSYKIIDNCGYIMVPPFHGTNARLKREYADTLQMAIKKLYGVGVKGWIIDLRQNTGGDMEPMIAGLGPLFSSVKLGALVNVNNQPNAWHYSNGKYFWDDGYSSVVSHPVSLENKLPVAVLTGNQTGSSGEAVAISFIGNEKTRFFGQPTWGLTTGNGSFDLLDGANIHLASTIMADRNGKTYSGPIQPDEIIQSISQESGDITMQTAIAWILKQR